MHKLLPIAAIALLAVAAWLLFFRGGPPEDVTGATEQLADAALSAPEPGEGEYRHSISTDKRTIRNGSGEDAFDYDVEFTREAWLDAKGNGLRRLTQEYTWSSPEDEATAKRLREQQETDGAGVAPVPLLDGEKSVELVCRVNAAQQGGYAGQLAREGKFDDPSEVWDEVEDAAEVPGSDDDATALSAWNYIIGALKPGETALTAQQRATALRALAYAPGVSVIGGDKAPDGTDAIGLRIAAGDASEEDWFAADSGWLVHSTVSGTVGATGATGSSAEPVELNRYELKTNEIASPPADLKPAEPGTAKGVLRCLDPAE